MMQAGQFCFLLLIQVQIPWPMPGNCPRRIDTHCTRKTIMGLYLSLSFLHLLIMATLALGGSKFGCWCSRSTGLLCQGPPGPSRYLQGLQGLQDPPGARGLQRFSGPPSSSLQTPPETFRNLQETSTASILGASRQGFSRGLRGLQGPPDTFRLDPEP